MLDLEPSTATSAELELRDEVGQLRERVDLLIDELRQAQEEAANCAVESAELRGAVAELRRQCDDLRADMLRLSTGKMKRDSDRLDRVIAALAKLAERSIDKLGSPLASGLGKALAAAGALAAAYYLGTAHLTNPAPQPPPPAVVAPRAPREDP